MPVVDGGASASVAFNRRTQRLGRWNWTASYDGETPLTTACHDASTLVVKRR